MQKLLPLSFIFVLLLAFLIPLSVNAATTTTTSSSTEPTTAAATTVAVISESTTAAPVTTATESATAVTTTAESINIYNAFKVLIFLISVLVGSALARAFSFWKW